jgi:hypothetical protein
MQTRFFNKAYRSFMQTRIAGITIIALIALQACEVYKQDDYQEFYVVEAFLTAG